MAGHFELSKSSDGQFRFVLKASNGEIILTSELYKTRAAAGNGIASVPTNSPLAERYEKDSQQRQGAFQPQGCQPSGYRHKPALCLGGIARCGH